MKRQVWKVALSFRGVCNQNGHIYNVVLNPQIMESISGRCLWEEAARVRWMRWERERGSLCVTRVNVLFTEMVVWPGSLSLPLLSNKAVISDTSDCWVVRLLVYMDVFCVADWIDAAAAVATGEPRGDRDDIDDRIQSGWLLRCADTTAASLCGGFNYDSTAVRQAFDCLSKVIEVTVT